jgi:[ribosomal protein S5]-alanine N-acetyltransferase
MVALRRFTPADAPRLFAMSQQRGLRAWIPDQVYADERQAREVLLHLIAQYDSPHAARQDPVVLGVCLRDGGDLVGHVGLSPIADGVEIGYAIDDAQQGRGLATEAVAAMTDWGFQTLALPAVDGIVARDNIASCRVLEKAGFVLVGEATRPLHLVTQLVRTYRKTQGSRT